jgi:ribosomal protein S27AE
MKICKKCGAEKPLTEYYKHKGFADGHLNKCKDCAKSDARKNRDDKLEYYREYDRMRHRDDPERRAYSHAQSAAWRKENPERHGELVRSWQERNPEKRSAHIKVGNAIKSGKLIKGLCEVCGSSKVHAHHDDYSRPLDVRWLCPEHHSLEHSKRE